MLYYYYLPVVEYTIQQSYSWAYLFKKKQNIIWKDTYTLMFVSGTVHNNQDMEAT